jgi:phage terminase large subunit
VPAPAPTIEPAGHAALARWYDQPAAFGEDVFGLVPWSGQRAIMDAVARHARVSVRSGHKCGKALALDTEIPTPTGWRRMEELNVGDKVFDDEGRPCRITATSLWPERPVMRVTFEDATEVVADERHEWPLTLAPVTAMETGQIHRAMAAGRRLAVPVRDRRGSLPIRSVAPLSAPQTTKCIEVDSPSHLYLCSPSLIPTHNSLTFAVLALWWAMTRREPRVILLAPTHRQIEEIVWREIVTLYQRRAKFPLGGRCFTKPDEGIRWSDGGQIFGFSTDRKENVAGYSGNILYLLDEASGIHDAMHEVVATSPTGKVAMISNPTRNSGAFYRSHHSGRDVWRCLHLSSEQAARENPIVTLPSGERRALMPGLADEDWVSARRTEYGEASYFYDVRVRGEFSREESNAVLPLGLVTAAAERHADVSRDGPLCIGVDVARFGADDSSMVPRRGNWTGPVEIHHGSDNVEIAGRTLALAELHRRPGERVSVRVDTSSGGGVADILRRHPTVDVVDVMAQEKATDSQYSRRRDELWFAMRRWLRDGGIAPGDDRLIADLTAPTYDWDESGRIKVESKRELRKRLGRSTDRADALALAVMPAEGRVWDPDYVELTRR